MNRQRRAGRRVSGLGAAWAWCLAVLGAGAMPALGQGASPVFVDDSPRAAEAMIRAGELASIGNTDEACRVLQVLLLDDGQRLLASAGDPDLFVSVRTRVQEMLLANPALLERYRELEEGAAGRDLLEGKLGLVESARLLTPSGFEAALRLAQVRMEAAQFESAWHTLAALERHPDLRGPTGPAAAELALRIAAYVDAASGAPSALGARVRAAVVRWGLDQGQGEGVVAQAPALERVLWALSPAAPVRLAELLPRPLWSGSLGEALPIASTGGERQQGQRVPEQAQWLLAAPTAVGDSVYVSDTQTISAWNRFTLSPRWRVQVNSNSGRPTAVGPQSALEELSTVAAGHGVVVTVTGLSVQNSPKSGRAVLALDAQTGSPLWSRSVQDLTREEPDEAALRGPAVIDQGVVVVALERNAARRRLESTVLVGLDVRDGSVLWERPLVSAGALPFGARPVMGDAPLVYEGVVYRADKIGVIGAVDAVDGRVRWARRGAGVSFVGGRSDQPWEMNIPVIGESHLFSLSPGRTEVLMLDRATGALLASSPASRWANADYLLVSAGMLVGVSSSSIVAAPLGEFGAEVETKALLRVQPPRMIRGRVVVVGDQLLVPLNEGVQLLDPRGTGPRPEDLIVLDKPGNVLPLESQLVVVDDREVHTYLVWDAAERLLRERMESEPRNPSPAVTYAELSFRAGRGEGVLPALDRALSALEVDPLAEGGDQAQARVFAAILEMVEPPSGVAPPTRLDPATRAGLIDRLGRAASSPGERVAHHLAAGRHAEGAEQPEKAVEHYQAVLDEPALASARFSFAQTVVSAEFEATRRLRQLIRERGAGLYDAYQADADRLLDQASERMEPEAFEAIARRYPVSRAAARAWSEAAARYQRLGRAPLAAQALEEGLSAARGVLAPDDPLLSELTGQLVQQLARTGLLFPAIERVRQFVREHPGRSLTEGGQTIDPQALLASLESRLRETERRPRLGDRASGIARLVGWVAEAALAPPAGGPVTDRLMMRQVETDELALWRVDDAGAMGLMWGGVMDETLLWLDGSGVYLARAQGEGYAADHVFVRRDLTTGAVLWESRAFRGHFELGAQDQEIARDPHDPPRVIETPLRPGAPVNGLTLAFDPQTLVVVERMGRVVAYDLSSGRTLWTSASSVSPVHDVAVRNGVLSIAGSTSGALGVASGLCLALDARTGGELHRIESARGARWTRVSYEGFVLLGLNDAVLAVDPYRGNERWRASAEPLRDAVEVWVLPGRILARSSDTRLWQAQTADGVFRAEPLDHAGRLDAGFSSAEVIALGQDAALSTWLGVVLFGPDGSLIGRDLAEIGTTFVPPVFGEQRAAALERTGRPTEDGAAWLCRLTVYDTQSLKALSSADLVVEAEPASLTLVDGVLLVAVDGSTLVVGVPARDGAVGPGGEPEGAGAVLRPPPAPVPAPEREQEADEPEGGQP